MNEPNSNNILTSSQHCIEDARFTIRSRVYHAENSLWEKAFLPKAILLILCRARQGHKTHEAHDGPELS